MRNSKDAAIGVAKKEKRALRLWQSPFGALASELPLSEWPFKSGDGEAAPAALGGAVLFCPRVA